MMPASGCCWEATSASRIYGTKLKNLLMGRGSFNNIHQGKDREECFDDSHFPCKNQSVIETRHICVGNWLKLFELYLCICRDGQGSIYYYYYHHHDDVFLSMDDG
jgi:hypothetical protein